MYHLVTECRACGYGQPSQPSGTKSAAPTEALVPVLDLGIQPLANDFRRSPEERAGFAPLQVLYCPRCTLAMLSVVVRPDILYRHYSYRTSPSKTMRDHFDTLYRDLRAEIEPGSVVEIGSNDGLFLAFLADRGFGNVIGVDPSTNLADEAQKVGIVTVNDFFNSDSANAAKGMAGRVSLVVARHVFCHVDNWLGFMKSLDVLCERDTLIAIEVPWAVDQINQGSFDQIYHEHLSFMTVRAMRSLLLTTPFHLHRITHYDIHGGAMCFMLRRNDSTTPPHPSVEKYLAEECVSVNLWRAFESKSKLQIVEFAQTIHELCAQKKRICGYGASAKSTVWINAAGLTRHEIAFICDSTREKLFCGSPGTEIPIVNEGEHFTQCMDYAILFAWNYKAEILAREKRFSDGGGKWIVPVPELQIV